MASSSAAGVETDAYVCVCCERMREAVSARLAEDVYMGSGFGVEGHERIGVT